MSQDHRASTTRLAGLRGRRLRSIDRARLLLGSAALTVFALGGILSVTTDRGTQPLRALGLQTALFPTRAAALPAEPADTSRPVAPPAVLASAANVAAPAPAAAPRAAEPADVASEASAETSSEATGAFFQEGHSSYYAHELAGRPTASGEPFNPEGLTAAHKTLPLGTRVRVTSVQNGKSVIVRINDRGPFVRGRILDLSLAAARAIGLRSSGGGDVRIHILGRGPRRVREVSASVAADQTVSETRRTSRTPDASARPMRTAEEILGVSPDSTTP